MTNFEKKIKFTFENGTYVITENLDQAMAAIKAEFGILLRPIKREKIN